MDDLIKRQDAIDAMSIGEEFLNKVLDDMDIVGNEREKYEWGLGLIESYINDIKELPSAQKTGSWNLSRCSNCGNVDVEEPNYCSRCGSFNGGEYE